MSTTTTATAKDADAGLLPTLAAFALGLAGLTHAALAAQFLMLWVLTTLQWLWIVGMGGFGVLAVVVAWKLGQARSWAAIVGSVLAPLLGFMSFAFTAYALWNWSFALYMLFAPPAAALALVLAPLSIGPCRRAEKAAAELRKQYRGGPFSGLDR